MKAIFEYWPVLLQGFWVTVWLAVCTIVGGAVGAVVIGALRLSKSRRVRAATMFFVECWRGPSALVWMFWVFFALPVIPGMPRMSPTAAAILVLVLEASAYGSEVVRAGLESVHRGQSDACHALGLSKLQAFTKVILPQALSQVVPGFGSMARSMIKWTAIVSFVGVQDLIYVANYVRGQTYETVTVFMLLAATYWFLCLICAYAFRALERVLPLNRALRAAQAATKTARSTDMRPAGAV